MECNFFVDEYLAMEKYRQDLEDLRNAISEERKQLFSDRKGLDELLAKIQKER